MNLLTVTLGLLVAGTGLLASLHHDRQVRDRIPLVDQKRAAWGRGDLRVGLIRTVGSGERPDTRIVSRNHGGLTRTMDPVQTARTI